MSAEKILITGANGQIGTVLTEALRNQHGKTSVIASDIRIGKFEDGPFEILDVLDIKSLRRIIKKYKINTIYHLAAILSAKAEEHPRKAWDINTNGLLNVLDMAKEFQLRLFIPSSIAVFGSHTPQYDTPQETILHPETVYGISKVVGEDWSQYYYLHYGVDVRSLRFPGIIGYQSMPGGGTTDYAVEIYHASLKEGHYKCFLKEDAMLPMMYMDDAIRSILEIMEAPAEKIKTRTSYNLAAMSFTPKDIYESIKKFIPELTIEYAPDYRQEIADSWPKSLDDHEARNDWGWKHEFDLDKMTEDMLEHLK